MKGKCFARTLLLGAVLLAAACRPDVGATPGDFVPVISAVFDPANGVVPMPNNVLISSLPSGGVGIQVPTTLDTTDADGNAATVAAFTPTMEEFVKSYLNRLDAFPVDMPMTLAFSKITAQSGAADAKAPPVVDKTTLTAKNIKVYDVTELLAGTQNPNVPEVTGLAIGDLAERTGMRTMLQDGAVKVLE